MGRRKEGRKEGRRRDGGGDRGVFIPLGLVSKIAKNHLEEDSEDLIR